MVVLSWRIGEVFEGKLAWKFEIQKTYVVKTARLGRASC